jgi:hypothetical protein
MYEGVHKSFRTGRLERELHTVQLSATRCSCIAILWVSLVSFAAITLCVASQRGFIVAVVYFVIDAVRKLLDTPSYLLLNLLTVDCFAIKYWTQSSSAWCIVGSEGLDLIVLKIIHFFVWIRVKIKPSLCLSTSTLRHVGEKAKLYTFLISAPDAGEWCFTLRRAEAKYVTSGVRFPWGAVTFLFATTSRSALGPATFVINGYRRLKRPQSEADHSHISSVEVKLHLHSAHILMAWCLTHGFHVTVSYNNNLQRSVPRQNVQNGCSRQFYTLFVICSTVINTYKMFHSTVLLIYRVKIKKYLNRSPKLTQNEFLTRHWMASEVFPPQGLPRWYCRCQAQLSRCALLQNILRKTINRFIFSFRFNSGNLLVTLSFRMSAKITREL